MLVNDETINTILVLVALVLLGLVVREKAPAIWAWVVGL